MTCYGKVYIITELQHINQHYKDFLKYRTNNLPKYWNWSNAQVNDLESVKCLIFNNTEAYYNETDMS